jgi:hypothetical protein
MLFDFSTTNGKVSAPTPSVFEASNSLPLRTNYFATHLAANFIIGTFLVPTFLVPTFLVPTFLIPTLTFTLTLALPP